jgi:hypothetical protein
MYNKFLLQLLCSMMLLTVYTRVCCLAILASSTLLALGETVLRVAWMMITKEAICLMTLSVVHVHHTVVTHQEGQ